MKNFRCLETKQERVEFINSLFLSQEIQSNINKVPELIQLVEDFVKYPRFIAEYSNQEFEHAHFYSWFNILILRDYDNKVIQDLYYIHELKHITTLAYDSQMKFDEWKNKMIQNELEAALLSEVQIYSLIPDLRAKTFSYPIWADELSEDVKNDFALLKEARLVAMKTPKTEVEKTLFRYNMSNDSWAEVWRVNYQKVEKTLEQFYKDENIKKFILNFAIESDKEQIIFEDEAKKFTEAYLRLKKETNT
jgi:hypothetical protein